MPATLPRVLEDKLNHLAQQVRRLRLIRGLSWLLLCALTAGLAALLIDYRFDVSATGRGVLLLGWVATTLVSAWLLVLRPLRRPIPPAVLAAAIEAKFPSLAERLSSIVDLSENADAGNGSKSLIDVLCKETGQRAKRLNFFRAAPAGRSARLMVLTFVATLVATVLVLTVTGAGDRVRRFLLPWYTPRVSVPYEIQVTSGNVVAKKGEVVTLSAVLKRTGDPAYQLPETATVVYKEVDGDAEKKLPMTAEGAASFHVSRPGSANDFSYCVEAGPARSDWFTVIIADPVDLADGSSFTLTPPAYAKPTYEPATLPGLHEFEGLQYTRVAFDLKFNRPAKDVAFEWKPGDPNSAVQTHRFAVVLNPDRTSGKADYMLLGDGTLKLILVGEKAVRTEIVVATKAVVDGPPKFVKVTGVSDQPQDIRPDDRLPIEIAVEDDVKVETLVLEYTLNDKELPFFTVPLPVKGVGTRRAEGTYSFAVGAVAKEGDTIRYRVRAADGRNLPDAGLKPQEIVFPEKGWGTLKLNASAKPLAEQEVLGQRDKLAEKLKAIAKELEGAYREADRLKREAAGKPALPIDQSVRLENTRAAAKDSARTLDDLAREAALTPDLRNLAGAMRGVAEGDLRQTDDAFRKAGNEADADARDKHLGDAVVKLESAADAVRALVEQNEKLAKDRLDQKTLEKLAAEQAALAEEAKKNANDPAKAKEIAAKQAELEKKLRDLVAGNETLHKAIAAAAGEEARNLADAARKLTDDQNALADAADRNNAAARRQAFENVNKRQQEVADKAAELAKKTQTPAKLADTSPVDAEQFPKAGAELAKQNPVGAMTEQEKAARELDRLAEALERAAAARKDTREAVRQFARAEDELRKRLQEATAEKPLDQLPEEQRKQMAAEQEALRRATKKLSVPPADAAAKKAQQEAVDALAKARDAMANGQNADEAMAEAASSLRRLGEKLPSREQRLKATRNEIEKLQREQNELSKQVADTLKANGKKSDPAAQKELADKLADAAKKQDELSKKVRDLDTPGLESRKERTADAAGRATDDLKNGFPQDIPASQQQARDELERLRQAADGKKPADELADELARKQKQVADAASGMKGKPTPGQLQEMQELQREIGKQLSGLNDPAGAERLSRTKEAVAAAEKALQKPDDVDELKKKTKEAEKALDALANDLAGAEPDAARVERLAREQQQRAEAAKGNENKPTTPEETANEVRELERQIAELDRTRTGKAQEAKQKAGEQLERIRKQPNPERSPGMQKAAADSLKELADEMRKNADRGTGQPRPGEQPDPAEGGPVPSKQDAEAARELAKEQRQIREQTGKAAEQAGKGPQPTDKGEMEKLAVEQQKLADDAKQANADGAQAAQRAADALKAGNPEQAAKIGQEAAKAMEKQAANGNADAKKMGERQKQIAEKAERAAGDPGAAAAQQQGRQDDLAKKAGDLAEALDKAAKDPATDPQKVDKDKLKEAAGDAKRAQAQMERANREAAAGRKPGADDARNQAAEAMNKAADKAQAAAGDKPGDKKPDGNAQAAGKAVQEAGEKMDQAEKQLGQKGGGKAGEKMQQAADKLNEAAEKMAKAGEGEKSPGPAGSGDKPGGNDGSGKGTPTADDLPKDVAQYLGKPWGELPGDVRSKIIQDLQAKYGEDYARVIKLYFEQLAERK